MVRPELLGSPDKFAEASKFFVSFLLLFWRFPELKLTRVFSWQVGRAHFEMVDYKEAERAFSWARRLCPHRLEGLDVYSTLLWVRHGQLLSDQKRQFKALTVWSLTNRSIGGTTVCFYAVPLSPSDHLVPESLLLYAAYEEGGRAQLLSSGGHCHGPHVALRLVRVLRSLFLLQFATGQRSSE